MAVIVPAKNEEKVIAETINSLLGHIPARDIYVVSDGSSDNTVGQVEKLFPREIFNAEQFSRSGVVFVTFPKLLDFKESHGKAGVINKVIKDYRLAYKYQYIMFMDADSLVTDSYVKEILNHFDKDTKKEIACLVGKVEGRNNGWLPSYRIWEYEISQSIHKKAQSLIGSVIVCPGCATIARSDIFKKIDFPTGTITEDMDLTFLIHRQKLGRVVFNPKAVVTTQDPNNLSDFLKQIDRWYTGFWQCVIKHQIPWGGQLLDLEVALLALEGIFNGILVLGLMFLLPILVVNNRELFLLVLGLDLFLFMLPSLIFVSYQKKDLRLMAYFPFFYFVRLLASLVFLKSFIKTFFKLDLKMNWRQAKRYSLTSLKEELWPNQFRRLMAFR